ncbi:hypothetical protein PBC5_068 [Bacillus phage PBC5]|nr:hypothetical protein PBC5_068 [Bacillus phage PBC5]
MISVEEMMNPTHQVRFLWMVHINDFNSFAIVSKSRDIQGALDDAKPMVARGESIKSITYQREVKLPIEVKA